MNRYAALLCLSFLAISTPGYTQAPTIENEAVPTEASQEPETNSFLEKLSFPLTEDKLIAYIHAGEKIKAVNAPWDALIAGAKTDTLAMEYYQQHKEELGNALENFAGISEAEYREIYKLSLQEQQFNQVIMAVKKGLEAQEQPSAPNKNPDELAPQSLSSQGAESIDKNATR